MKIYILTLISFFPFLVLAEYNGVYLEFDIELNNGSKVHGFKYVTHEDNTADYKKQLEDNYAIFLQNQLTYEPGEYGYYLKRLEYNYNDTFIYKLITPKAIDLKNIKSVTITDMIIASYAIQIVGDYNREDQSWMNTEAVIKYSEYEDMCTYDIFIHNTEAVSNTLITKIKAIINSTEIKIQKKLRVLGSSEENDEKLFEAEIQKLYKERTLMLSHFLKTNPQLKPIIISMCTC